MANNILQVRWNHLRTGQAKHTELLPQHPILVHLEIQMLAKNNARKDIDILLKFSNTINLASLFPINCQSRCILLFSSNMLIDQAEVFKYILLTKAASSSSITLSMLDEPMPKIFVTLLFLVSNGFLPLNTW